MRLSRKFYSRNTKTVAKELLGKILVHKKCKGKIVETEAYFGKYDPASHAYCKITKRNIIMYQKPGTAYVYFTYGNHWMFNVVTEKKGIPGAVLIRAVEPLNGIEIMKRRRKINNIKNLTNGPGKLTKAFSINKKHNCLDLTKSNLFIENSNEKFKIVKTTRIGLSKGQEKLLRFYIKDNGFVSKK
ncbi:MAG: DNA-3-methyladenine glycosylase [Candidatus Aenigmarchaeota archaeon]|nr:DNA-3-methyladenine glycosylase [Candidatus Aenigmarchaeota archaeon]